MLAEFMILQNEIKVVRSLISFFLPVVKPITYRSLEEDTEVINSGGYSPGVPPLPIPNREVKPRRADGTAPQCGRVGRRLFSTAVFQEISCETAFFVILSGQIDIDCTF